ncbi:MAG: CYTH domain-containing protein [Bacteroidales bacterium]|nr:CYTH domain-containing protein [Bacteroidales bacterium]
MGQETERKFLVAGDFRPFVSVSRRIVQGYLCREKGRTVRVRIRDRKGFLTIKGPGSLSGMTRSEWEYEIPLADAEGLMALCEEGMIEKIRYEVPYGGFVFEVDEFSGDNEGLILAEIELPSEDALFSRPSWLGTEVTGDVRYYNSSLTKNPYKRWK